jgi:hypothetical protein
VPANTYGTPRVRRSDQLTTHHHGEADHLTWLERPFAEALRALEERDRSR